MDILSLLPTILGLVKAVPTMQAQFKGQNLGPQTETANEINQLARAQTNTTNPLFQSLNQQNRQAGQSQLAEVISGLQNQNRLGQSIGRTPLLDQERGGEGIFRNLMKGYEDVGNQSTAQTFGQLHDAQGAMQGNYNNQNNLSGAQFGNTKMKTQGYSTLSDALSNMFGLNKPQQPQAASVTTGQPAYNPAQTDQSLYSPQGKAYQALTQPQTGMQNYGLPQTWGSQATGGWG